MSIIQELIGREMYDYFVDGYNLREIAAMYRMSAKAVSLYIAIYNGQGFPNIELYIEACNKGLDVQDIICMQEEGYMISEIIKGEWIDGEFEPEQIIFLGKITNEDQPNNPSVL